MLEQLTKETFSLTCIQLEVPTSANVNQKIVQGCGPFSINCSSFKGLRHYDFAVLGQFCAQIITLCLYPYRKCSCETMRKLSNEFYQGRLTIVILLVIFEDIASKSEKISPMHVFKFQSISILAIRSNRDERKQFQGRKKV